MNIFNKYICILSRPFIDGTETKDMNSSEKEIGEGMERLVKAGRENSYFQYWDIWIGWYTGEAKVNR